MNSESELRSFLRLGSIELGDDIVRPYRRDMREVERLLHTEHELKHTRGRKRKLLNLPPDGGGDGAGYGGAHIENWNLARSLGAERTDGRRPLVKAHCD